MSSIFISHRNKPNDNAWSERIQAWIKAQKGIDGFLDFDVQQGLQAGDRWEDEIYAAMNRAQVVIALISPDWLASDWCMSEARMAKLRGLKLIPLIIAECDFPFQDIQAINLGKKGEERAFEELRQALSTTHKLPVRPYPGLAAFQEDDAAVFFGREDETQDLINKVDSLFQGRPETPRLLLVLGASGSGKSSLLRAGLIPGFKAGQAQICVEPIIPRGAPLRELAHALDISLDGVDAAVDADAIFAALKRANPSYQRALISIDQAEELLRSDQSYFLDVLRALINRGEGRVLVLATMRSDFLNEFQQSGLIGAGSALDYSTFTLDPLSEDRLTAIIQKPAELFGVRYQDGLIAEITKDHGGPDALPLLAFFLNEFWREEYTSDGVLQIAEYKSFGGLNKALSKAVDRSLEASAQLDAAYDNLRSLLDDLEEVFLGHLVSVSAISGEAVRSRARAETLSDKELSLLTAFANQRLLIEKDGDWEVVHEALFRQWRDLRAWIDAAREDLITIDRIQTASAHWQEAARDDADLTHTGNRLSEAARLTRSNRYAARFLAVDLEYLDACEMKYRDQLAREATLRKEAEKDRIRAQQSEGRATHRTKIAAVVAFIAFLASGAALWQWDLAREQTAEAEQNAKRAMKETERAEGLRVEAERASDAAIRQRAAAEQQLHRAKVSRARFLVAKAGELVAGGNIYDAIAVAVAAMPQANPKGWPSIDEIPQVAEALTAAMNALPEGFALDPHNSSDVLAATFSPNGKQILTASADGKARIWNAETGEVLVSMEGHGAAVMTAAYSTDGRRVLTGSADGTVREWDASTGERTKRVTGNSSGGWVWLVKYDASGKNVIYATDHNNAAGRPRTMLLRSGYPKELEDRVTGGRTEGGSLLGRHTERVRNIIDMGPAGYITAGNDGTVRRWVSNRNYSGGVEVRILEEFPDTVWDMEVIPGSNNVVVATGTSAVVLRNGFHQDARQLGEHSGTVRALALSPDGSSVATASLDGTAAIWYFETGALSARMTGHEEGVLSVEFSPDGSRLLTTSLDRTTRVWNSETGALISTLRLAHGWIWSASFAPDGARIVTASSDGRARIWNAETGEVMKTLSLDDPGAPPTATTAWASNSSTPILTAARDNPRIWGLAVSSGEAKAYTVSKDGRVYVAGAELLPDAEEGSDHGGAAALSTFSNNGTVVLHSDEQGVIVWAQENGLKTLSLEGKVNGLTIKTLSQDGSRIVGMHPDWSLAIWDVQTGRLVGPVIGSDGYGSDHLFARQNIETTFDGGLVFAKQGKEGVRVWNTRSGETILDEVEIKERGSIFTLGDFDLSPDGKLLTSVGGEYLDRRFVGVLRVWDAASGKLMGKAKRTSLINGRVKFSPDSRLLAGRGPDNSVTIWEVATQTHLKTLTGHSEAITEIEFSASGAMLATASWDGTVRVWDVDTSGSVAVFSGHGVGATKSVRSLRFSSDDRFLLTEDSNASRVWSLQADETHLYERAARLVSHVAPLTRAQKCTMSLIETCR